MNLTEVEKEIFLHASIEVKKNQPNKEIIEEAYTILASKSFENGQDQHNNSEENTTRTAKTLKKEKQYLDERSNKNTTTKNSDPNKEHKKISDSDFPNERISKKRSSVFKYIIAFVSIISIIAIVAFYLKGYNLFPIKTVDSEKIVVRNDLAYMVNQEKPFTGIAVEKDNDKPDSPIFRKIYLKDGKVYKLEEFNRDGKPKMAAKIKDEHLATYNKDNVFTHGNVHATLWYKNGQKRVEGDFINGQSNGHIMAWYKNGQKKFEGDFVMEQVPYGHIIYWYENGQKQIDGNFINQSPYGHVNLWHKNGQKWVVGDYHWDAKLAKQLFDKQLPKKYIYDKLYLYETVWYENDQKYLEHKLLDNSNIIRITYWYRNGQKKFEGNYSTNGKLNGDVTIWFENGQKKFEGTFAEGKPRSSIRKWTKDGKIIHDEKDNIYNKGDIEIDANWFLYDWEDLGIDFTI